MTDTQPRRVLVERPSEIVILAARHLDSTEGISHPGRVLTVSDCGAINTVLRYVSKAHNSPDHEVEHAASDNAVRVEAGELRRVEVRPGDLFALSVRNDLSAQQVSDLSEYWHATVGDGVPLVVLPPRAELTLYRPAEEAGGEQPSARDALLERLGETSGHDAEADQALIDAALTEALTSPRYHEHVVALLRRESRIRNKPMHELNGWS